MSNMEDESNGDWNPFSSATPLPAHSGYWQARRALAAGLRRLVDAAVTTTVDIQALEDATDAARRITDALQAEPGLPGLLGYQKHGGYGSFGQLNQELNAVGGHSNPITPGLHMQVKGDQATGSVRFSHAFEGPPGCVHGGHIAALLDQFLGMAQIVGKQPGMTGTLSVRYLQPTPIEQELTLIAEVSTEGERKTRVRGKVMFGETVTATGEGLFVRPRQSPAAMAR